MDDKNTRLPEKGLAKTKILKKMKSYGEGDANYKEGKTWSLVYYLGEEHTQFLKDAYTMYFSENGLSPMAFLSLKRFESEVIRMVANMFHGGSEAVGTMTSGGTESCLLAVKTYRDMAGARRPWIRNPEMVVPESIHVAFEKGAEYFGVKAVHAPLDKDYRVNLKAVKKRINRNTILLIGSAPGYPHGVIDPIEELGAIAQKKRIPLHVDACLGGFLLPFIEKLGHEIPKFDFRVPGVTSISADIHKYGFSAKGASTITYRNMNYMKHQIYVYENWPGGIYASPALLGTRPGGSIAAAWASMMAIGEDGYIKNAKTIMNATRILMEGVRSIPELEVIGNPVMSVFAYKSNTRQVDIFAVGDQMEKKGWNIDRQQKPESLHAMVTPLHQDVTDDFISDLKESVEFAKGHPELAVKGGAAMYGMIANIPLRSMIKKNVLKMMMDMYGADGKLPNMDNAEQADDLATKAGIMFLEMKKKIAGRLGK